MQQRPRPRLARPTAAALLLPVAGAVAIVGASGAVAAGRPSATAPVTVAAPAVQVFPFHAAGTVPDIDPWLVTKLAATAPTAQVRVFVRGQDSFDQARAAVLAAGLLPDVRMDDIRTQVAVGTPAQVRALFASTSLAWVEGDQPISFALDTATRATRGQQAEDELTGANGVKLDGTGVGVAIIDGGVDGTHPFFRAPVGGVQGTGASKVVFNGKDACATAALNPSDATVDTCIQDQSTTVNDTDTESAGGHGTHVAGIVAGYDTDATRGGSPLHLHGEAPGATITSISVGAAISIYGGNMGLYWVHKHHLQPCGASVSATVCPPIKVTNNSYGPSGGGTFSATSTTVVIQRMLLTDGVVTVWAAGNDGGDGAGMGGDTGTTAENTNPPGQDPTPGILMVASYNDGGSGTRDGSLSSFSSRGIRGTQSTYPDISAPGDTITSSCRLTLSVCSEGLDPVNGPGATDMGTFNTISGTSMATPMTVGAVAQLFQAKPDATPAEIEYALEDTAHRYGDAGTYESDTTEYTASQTAAGTKPTLTSFDRGHGLIDVYAAAALLKGVPDPGVPASAAVCTPTSPAFTDPAGDATMTVTVATPIPNQPSVDLQRGAWSYDGTKMTFTTSVTNLAAGPPTGSQGEYFRTYFTVLGAGAQELNVISSRGTATSATATSFSLRYTPPTGSTATAISLALTDAAFDTATSTFRFSFTVAQYNSTFATPLAAPKLGAGSVIALTQPALGQRQEGTSTLTTDTAASVCPYTVAEATPAAVLPEAPLVVLIPVAGLAAAAVVRRRRRVAA